MIRENPHTDFTVQQLATLCDTSKAQVLEALRQLDDEAYISIQEG